jgi:hypothetical protein
MTSPTSGTKRKKTTEKGLRMAATVKEMDGSQGFDAVVVCTSNAAQEAYWQERLEATRGQAAKAGAVIVAVHEDWAADGAGNGLGTLYAYTKAKAKAALQGADLDAMLASGGTVGIYHTAGKGTRLAPLPGAENNNKPGVKLPSLVEVSPGVTSELTILEAVVRQTGCYAPHRAGRCSVFWGDQIFVPAAGHLPSGSHHADILAQMGPMPSEEEWTLKGLDKYGLITVNDQNEAAQVEKVSYETAQHLLEDFRQGDLRRALTRVLLAVQRDAHGAPHGVRRGSRVQAGEDGLRPALLDAPDARQGRLRVRHGHQGEFILILVWAIRMTSCFFSTQDETAEVAAAHHDRMQAFRAKLPTNRGVFGAIDVGEGCYWWDYGQLKLYLTNNVLAMNESEEAAGEFLSFNASTGN